MECTKIQEQLINFIENNLTEKEYSTIASHIKSCGNCKKEFENISSLLSSFSDEKLEYPSDNLRLNFEKMLSEERENQSQKIVQLQPEANWKSYLRVAASILLVTSAFFFGKYQNGISNQKTAATFNQEKIQKEKTLLVLMENQSASKRILAVGNSENFTKTDTKIIQALINRLFFDKNTNVRLAAAEALTRFTSEEMVKTALIKSLETEKNPSIQIELIQILVKIQEKRAIIPMRKMLADKETTSYVKQELQLNLSNLL